MQATSLSIHKRMALAGGRYEVAAGHLRAFEQGHGRPKLLTQLEQEFETAALAYEAVLVEFIKSRQPELVQ